MSALERGSLARVASGRQQDAECKGVQEAKREAMCKAPNGKLRYANSK